MSTQRKVKDWIDAFLYYTSDTEPRETYRRWVAISTIASVLQRKCWVQWGREVFYPNMYIVLVGPPAARKGTAIKEGKNLLDELGVSVAADEGSRQKLISALEESMAADPGEDGKAIYHSSLTILATELTVFLGYENFDMLSMLCKWFDCENRYVYDTFRGGRQEIPNIWVNILGATTPVQLQASLPEGAFGSGFTSRVVFVYEDDMDKIVIKPAVSEKQLQVHNFLKLDLEHIKSLKGEFVTTPDFEQVYTEWRMSSARKSLFPNEPRLDYYVQRRPAHLFKIAMIYAAARKDDMTLNGGDLKAAIASLEEAEKNMPHVFRGIGGNPLAAAQTRMMSIITKEKKLPVGNLLDMFQNDLSASQFREVIDGLVTMGFCERDHVTRTVKLTSK